MPVTLQAPGLTPEPLIVLPTVVGPGAKADAIYFRLLAERAQAALDRLNATYRTPAHEAENGGDADDPNDAEDFSRDQDGASPDTASR